MTLWTWIKSFFCKCNNNNVPTQDKDDNDISEEELTERKGQNNSKIPNDEFTCNKCETVPEILEIHSDTSKLSLECKKHPLTKISVSKYLNQLSKSNFSYRENKCYKCEKKAKEILMHFCIKCRNFVCERCKVYYHQEHEELGYLIPIEEKNNICKIHPKEKAENFCFDCEEIICEKDNNHSDHYKINTNCLQKEVNEYRETIRNKNKKLLNMLKFYRLVILYGTEENKNQVIEAIKNEKERNEHDIDLAIYHLKKKGSNKNKADKKKKIELIIE